MILSKKEVLQLQLRDLASLLSFSVYCMQRKEKSELLFKVLSVFFFFWFWLTVTECQSRWIIPSVQTTAIVCFFSPPFLLKSRHMFKSGT